MLEKFIDPNVHLFFKSHSPVFIMEIITDLIDEKTPVKRGTWQEPQANLGPVKPPQGDFRRESQSQMGSDSALCLGRTYRNLRESHQTAQGSWHRSLINNLHHPSETPWGASKKISLPQSHPRDGCERVSASVFVR